MHIIVDVIKRHISVCLTTWEIHKYEIQLIILKDMQLNDEWERVMQMPFIRNQLKGKMTHTKLTFMGVFFFPVLKHHVAFLPNTRLKVSLKQQTLLTPQAALFLLEVFLSLNLFHLVYKLHWRGLDEKQSFLAWLSGFTFAQFSPGYKYKICNRPM